MRPKAANGHASDSSNDCKQKPTARAEFSPLSGLQALHRRNRPMQMRTVAGVVELKVAYGQDPGDSHWGCPVRELWGLTSHQQLSLALEDKLAFTLTATSSYEEAAALAQKWGVPVTDSALHSLTRRLGSRAEAQTQEQLKSPPVEREPQRAPTKLGVLMLDGWQVRQRGPGWGKKKTQQNRVEWHEWKTGVYYRHEQSAHTAGGRGMIDEKISYRLARRACGVCQPTALGSAACRIGARPGQTGGGRRSPLDLEGGGGPLGRSGAKCWTSIMPANTCGMWGGPCTGTRRPPRLSGSNLAAINYGTDARNKCWPSWPD